MKYRFTVLVLILLASGFVFEVVAQSTDPSVKTGLLQSRHKDDALGTDNYEYATYSFLVGANGPAARKLIRNDWDIQYTMQGAVEKKVGYFHVTMVTDDRSRIVDLGKLEWNDVIELPDLPAFETPTREKDVQAKVGHVYYVHTADGDSDHYALFRVEEMKNQVEEMKNRGTVLISWKLVGTPSEGSK